MGVKITGGNKLKAFLKNLERIEKEKTVKAGFFQDATYPDRNHTPVAQVAAVQEFGSVRLTKDGKQWIPPRPFFRTAIAQNKEGWTHLLGLIFKKSEYDTSTALTTVGEKMIEDIKASIEASKSWQPNAPETVERKGFNAPLQDTKHMRDSLRSEVE